MLGRIMYIVCWTLLQLPRHLLWRWTLEGLENLPPPEQGALLVVKLMVPFALVSANVGILNRRLGITPSALFMVVVAVSDVLTLYFFWVVKDEGSWLEIGSTISHFAIASMLCVFVAGLEGVSALFIAGVEVGSDHDQAHGKESNGSAISDGAAKEKPNGVTPPSTEAVEIKPQSD